MITQGKWKHEPWSPQESQVVASYGGKRTLICAGVMPDDARLIAAAPCLLEAGERLIAAYKAKQEWPDNDTTKAFDRMLFEVEYAEDDMRAAIAKARGEA